MTVWDELAAEYDDHFRRPVDRAEDVALLRLIGPLEGLRVLDVGCGTAHFLDTLNGERPYHYLGVDPSRGMLTVAREKHSADEDVMFMHATSEEMMLYPSSGSFDLAISLWSLPYWRHREEGLKNVYEALRPGGRFFVLAYTSKYLYRPNHIAQGQGTADTPASLSRSLTQAGFSDVKVRPFRCLSDRFMDRVQVDQAAVWMVRETEQEKGYSECLNLIGEGWRAS